MHFYAQEVFGDDTPMVQRGQLENSEKACGGTVSSLYEAKLQNDVCAC